MAEEMVEYSKNNILARPDSPCLRRLIRLHREFSPYSANPEVMPDILIKAA